HNTMYPSNIINKKIIWILFITLSTFVLMSCRLLYLQIYCVDYFTLRSQKNFTRHEIIESPRGNIRDIHGNLLATNRPLTCLLWQGTGKKLLSSTQMDTLERLASITGLTLTSGSLFDKITWAERKNMRVILKEDIEFITLSKL